MEIEITLNEGSLKQIRNHLNLNSSQIEIITNELI